MNTAPSEEPVHPEVPHPDEVSWSPWQWLIGIALIFGLHVVLFHFLAKREPQQVRALRNTATVQLADPLPDTLALSDPTLFALPHPRGFAAFTWLQTTLVTNTPFRWTEAPRLLALPVDELGATFLKLAEKSRLPMPEIAFIPPAVPSVIAAIDLPPTRTNSVLRLDEVFATRPLRQPYPSLPLQPPSESLTNTVVQVLVNPRGQVVSASIVPSHPGNRSTEVEQTALQIARRLWFHPVPESTPPLLGRVIFEWATTPPTNAPAATP